MAGGWFGNAERLLADQPESSEHGFLALTRGMSEMLGGGNIAGGRSRSWSGRRRSRGASATATSR